MEIRSKEMAIIFNQDVPTLTRREKEIARNIIQVIEIKRVATKLNLSPWTVKTHCEKLRLKLNERNTIKAAMKASMLGLLEQ